MKFTNLLEVFEEYFDRHPESTSRRSMTKTSLVYTARAFGVVSPADIKVECLGSAPKKLKEHLLAIDGKLSKNSIRNYISFLNRLINDSTTEGIISKMEWEDELSKMWKRIFNSLESDTSCGSYKWGFSKLMQWSINHKLHPADLSKDDLSKFWEYLKSLRICIWNYAYWGARKWWLKGLEKGILPPLEFPHMSSVNKSYRVEKKAWSNQLKGEYHDYLKWVTKENNPDRPRKCNQRKITQKIVLATFQRIVGYLHNIKGIPLEDISFKTIFNKNNILDMLEWLKQRLGKSSRSHTMIINSLSTISYHYLKSDNKEWFTNLRNAYPSGPVKDKRDRMVTWKDLNRVIDGIDSEIHKAVSQKTRKKSQNSPYVPVLFRNKLMFVLLVYRGLRQRNIRECKYENNVWKDSEGIWRIKFEGQETKTGNKIIFQFPPKFVTVLEEYIDKYRPVLIKNTNTDLLFPSRNGKELPCTSVIRLIKGLCHKHLGKDINPHLFRDILATSYILENPKDYLTVSKILGHSNINTTLKMYSHFECANAAEAFDKFFDSSMKNKSQDNNGEIEES
ncbi:site-specific integrase [candidate division KSB1 bacterium]|nr:site-specific integrase [candidate division KSB1 bacterium]